MRRVCKKIILTFLLKFKFIKTRQSQQQLRSRRILFSHYLYDHHHVVPQMSIRCFISMVVFIPRNVINAQQVSQFPKGGKYRKFRRRCCYSSSISCLTWFGNVKIKGSLVQRKWEYITRNFTCKGITNGFIYLRKNFFVASSWKSINVRWTPRFNIVSTSQPATSTLLLLHDKHFWRWENVRNESLAITQAFTTLSSYTALLVLGCWFYRKLTLEKLLRCCSRELFNPRWYVRGVFGVE